MKGQKLLKPVTWTNKRQPGELPCEVTYADAVQCDGALGHSLDHALFSGSGCLLRSWKDGETSPKTQADIAALYEKGSPVAGKMSAYLDSMMKRHYLPAIKADLNKSIWGDHDAHIKAHKEYKEATFAKVYGTGKVLNAATIKAMAGDLVEFQIHTNGKPWTPKVGEWVERTIAGTGPWGKIGTKGQITEVHYEGFIAVKCEDGAISEWDSHKCKPVFAPSVKSHGVPSHNSHPPKGDAPAAWFDAWKAALCTKLKHGAFVAQWENDYMTDQMVFTCWIDGMLIKSAKVTGQVIHANPSPTFAFHALLNLL